MLYDSSNNNQRLNHLSRIKTQKRQIKQDQLLKITDRIEIGCS